MKVPSAVTYVLNRALWLYLAVLVVFAVSVDYKKAQYKRARYLLGVFYNEQLQNYSDGIVYFDYLSQLRPKEARNYFLLGYCYLYLQQYDKALIYFKRALVLGPGNLLWEQYLDYAQSKAAKDGRDVRIPEGIIDIPLE